MLWVLSPGEQCTTGGVPRPEAINCLGYVIDQKQDLFLSTFSLGFSLGGLEWRPWGTGSWFGMVGLTVPNNILARTVRDA